MMTTVVQEENMQIDRYSLGPYGTNCYIVTCLKTKESALIDAPAKAAEILGYLKGTTPKYILMTHNHEDHTGALKKVREKLGVPMAAHEADADELPIRPDMFLNDGDILKIGEITLEVISTPGHTPGSICYHCGHNLISGDTIFEGGPGKSWEPEELQQIIMSITEKIFTLPDDTRIFPGHGESTVVKKEKDEYAVFASKPHSPNLCGDIVWLKS